MDKETKEALPQQRIEKQLAELYLFMKRTNEYSEWWRESTLQQWVQELPGVAVLPLGAAEDRDHVHVSLLLLEFSDR